MVGAVVWYLLARPGLSSVAADVLWMKLFMLAAAPILFVPVLPLRYLVRKVCSVGGPSTVQVTVDELGIRWKGALGDRGGAMGAGQVLPVGLPSGAHLLISAENGGVFSLSIAEKGHAGRLLRAAARARAPAKLAFEFSVDRRHVAAHREALERASLAILWSVFLVISFAAFLIEPWLVYVMLIPGAIALVASVPLFSLSWGALLRKSATGNLVVDDSKVALDDVIVCLQSDRVEVEVLGEGCMKIAASRIPQGSCIIWPWRSGDRFELELIKATIEALNERSGEPEEEARLHPVESGSRGVS
jgi:hypothetical protein